jgi:ATP-dependent helicase/nuclease subunit A
MSSPHVAIRASAGSGKTFQLTNRLLALFLGGTPIDRIVAATFTRKAAGEILERVLRRLAEAASDDHAARALGEEVSVSGVARSRVLELLASLTRRLHQLRIGTLDSLFADLASGIGFELGMPPNWTILDPVEDDDLRNEAIRRMLAAGSTNDLLWLFRLLTKGETTRSVKRQIRDAVDELYTVFLATDEEQWAPFEIPPLLESSALAQSIADFESATIPKNKVWEKAHGEAVKASKALQWKEFVGSTLVQRVLDGADEYSRVKIGPAYRECCEPLIRHAGAAILGDLHRQTRAVFRLLEHFHLEYATLKFARRGMRFEDVTLKLARANFGVEGPDAGFRLGAHTEHLLLDEFQDTSPLQWKVVEPAASSIAAEAEGHGFFCVGDVKQAIYGWRGGSADLFERLKWDMPSLAWTDLATSYRSSPTIIETVNAVFGSLTSNPAFEGPNRESATTAAELWSDWFSQHSTARTDLPGYVCFRASRLIEGEDGEAEPDTYGDAARWIAEELKSAPDATVGVLTRKNTGVARMMHELRGLGIPASQEGGNPLTDATSVQAILAALRFADYPGDSAARFFVASTPLGPHLGLKQAAIDENGPRIASNIRRTLLDSGLGATLAQWSKVLLPHLGEREQDRLRRLVEFAFIREADASLRPSDFANHVERMVFEDPAAAQVRVMTIHQAKGLEFDVVVLPELDEKLVGQTPTAIAWSSKLGGLIDGVVRYVDKSVQALLPEKIRNAFEDRIVKEAREALCLLYVAVTRAARRLLVVTAPSATNEKSLPLTLAGVLRGALTKGERLEEGRIWHENGRAE